MSYPKDYYRVLSLEAPKHNSSDYHNSTEEIKKAYRNALLTAHPDKVQASKESAKKKSTSGKTLKNLYTIDDVKEAFAVLGDKQKRAEYDRWIAAQPAQPSDTASGGLSADFVLGLDLLDLSDFISVDEMEWTRTCRCGADRAFKIREEELEEAERRGEKEVLVGCEGCSLWLRVGFDVEEG
jgi:diphthamide biosynthesis protein 4